VTENGCGELLDLVELIHTPGRRKWRAVLKRIAKIAKADEAFLIQKEGNHLLCHASSSKLLSICRTLKSDTVALKTIENAMPLNIENYPDSELAHDSWIKLGLGSIISIPVGHNGEIYGALQVTSFNRKLDSDRISFELLTRIARILSLKFQEDLEREKYGKGIAVILKQMEFIHQNSLPKGYKDRRFEQWIKGYIRKILRTTSADAISFLLPEYEIYIAQSSAKETDPVIVYNFKNLPESLIALKLWKQKSKDVTIVQSNGTHKDLSADFANDNRIQSALFLPITINNQLMGIFAFGFSFPEKPTRGHRILLQSIAMHLILAIETSRNLHKFNSMLTETEERFIESFVLMMEARDFYTKGHSQRVAAYAKCIGEALNMDQKECSMLYIAGILHDVGKMGIPDAVLLKPGKLTEEEFKIMRHHPEFSYQIIKNIGRFRAISEYVLYHHERCDGSGYPKGLTCKQIPLGARILAIADVFDAITTQRPYRSALSLQEAHQFFMQSEGKFDMEILKRAFKSLERAYHKQNRTTPFRDFMPSIIDEIRTEMFRCDFMTGLLNRAAFLQQIKKLINESVRFVVFYVDIMNLSLINYRYSMEVGDRVILFTAEALKATGFAEHLSRTEPDVFCFVYTQREQPEELAVALQKHVKEYVVSRLKEVEMGLNSWNQTIDFYVSFSEYTPGKTPEDMMFECQRRKREIKRLLEGKDVSEHGDGLF